MVLDNIDFLNGNIEYNKFNVDPQLSYKEQVDRLDSNLLLVSYLNGKYVIDLVWLPAQDPDGKFSIRLIKDSHWNEPLLSKSSVSFFEMELYLQAYIYIIDNLLHNDSNIIVFDKTDKKRIYWLIELYLSSKIDLKLFVDEFHECYILELDDNSLTNLEAKIFAEIEELEGRFSPYEQDHASCPGFYSNEDELKAKIIETKRILLSNTV